MTGSSITTRGWGYWLMLFTLIGGSFVAANLVTAVRSSEPRFVTPLRTQQDALTIDELRITQPVGNPVEVSVSDSAAELVDEVRLELAPDGNLFVVFQTAEGRNFIREFSPRGELLNDFSGPGTPEIKSVTDMAFDQHHVWISDLLGSSVHRLERGTLSWTSTKHPAEPYRIETSIQGQDQLIVMRIGAPQLFDITDFKGNARASFGKLLVDQERHALVLDGFIARCGKFILFTGKHLGLLASFSDSGTLHYAVEPIESPDKPAVMRSGNKRWVRHGPLQASRYISGDSKRFGVLASRIRRVEVRSFIDLYRTSDGRYYKSLLLPANERWTSFAIGNGYLYVVSLRRIVCWPEIVLFGHGPEGRLSTGRSLIDFSSTTSQKGDLP